MPLSIKHEKVIAKTDGPDDSLLQPSDWNGEHEITIPAESLVGRSQDSEGDAEPIGLGAGLTFDSGTHTLSADADALQQGEIVVATAIDEAPNHRVLTDSDTVEWNKSVDNEVKAELVDEGVTLAHMELGVQGNVLYYGASGIPARLAAGESGRVLVAGGVGANPAWGFSGAPHAIIQGRKAVGTDEGTFTSGAWRTRLISNEAYDALDIVTLQPANRFRLAAGTYVVEWSAPAWRVNNHQSRLINVTDDVVLNYGLSSNSENTTGGTTLSGGTARFVVAANKDLEVQHQCQTTHASGFGTASGFGVSGSEVFTQVKIWRVA